MEKRKVAQYTVTKGYKNVFLKTKDNTMEDINCQGCQ